MIKRALGFFDGGRRDQKDVDEESDDGDGLTERQRRKLERRLLPGAAGAEGRPRRAAAPPRTVCQHPAEPACHRRRGGGVDPQDMALRARSGARPGAKADEDEEDEDDQSEDEDEEGSESDDEPLMPPEEEKQIRGQFRCELCPDKILMNEKLMETHLQSAGHRKNVRRFERAKELGVEAFEAECRERAAAREAVAASGQPSRRQRKNEEFWAKRREKSKKKSGGEKAKELTATQIEDRKRKFQAKKAQRELRKKGAAEGVAGKRPEASKKAAEAAAPVAGAAEPAREKEAKAGENASRLRRKALRAAKFAAAAGQAPQAAGAPAADAPAPGRRKKKRTPDAA
ncbi:unnamed protein product [Prorocentrum cordatum]|uniref:U1-type domain-containing protein n=1 Tax=Prorocentrum cordatum TaxID=2364126 RepID=A0ABN9SMD3_9DINO|nr:unnamed protein product [Polarella glacialis]